MRLTIVVFNDFIHVETITAGVLKLPIKCLQPDLSPPAGRLKEIQISEESGYILPQRGYSLYSNVSGIYRQEGSS